MPPTEEQEVISARVPRDLAEELRALAARQERTVSREVLLALKRHVKLHRRHRVGEDA